jgi:acyl-CoA reductase-like NAD-dependent aldehyde dehydrogenase
VQAHGPGFSKILVGDDQVDRWEQFLDVMVDSVFLNSGRGCINCSGIWASRHTHEIANAIAERLAKIRPLPPDNPDASLAAFTVPGMADAISQSLTRIFRATSLTAPRNTRRIAGCENGRANTGPGCHCAGPDAAIASK